MLFWMGCEGNAYFPSVHSVSEAWLEVKESLNSQDFSSSGLEMLCNDFCLTLDGFFTSPVGSLYRIHRPEEMESLESLYSAIERLKAAVLNGDSPSVFSITLEIDSGLAMLQYVDVSLSNRSQLHYFLLFFFSSLFVIFIILVLRFLTNRLVKAETSEQQSLVFSRETVMAQEQERERIARELHDTVAQDLLRLSLQTEIINKGAVSAEQRRLCEEVIDGQNELVSRIRNICDDLIPPDFQRSRLPDALQSLCYKFEQRTGIECQMTIQNGLKLDFLNDEMQLQCFRIVQECLANIEKHAGADEVSVIVHSNTGGYQGNPGALLICVSDNGKGFSPPDRDSCHKLRTEGHLGLWNMFERASSLNGSLAIDSQTGEGTMITLRIPITRSNE